ncbi:MAG: DUF2332 family protein [Burkholderiales bacterium]
MNADQVKEFALVRERFVRFAEADGSDDPLYVALATTIAQDDALLALLLEASPVQRLPVLLFACIHDCLLECADHPLAAYYASCGGTRAPDARLPDCLRDFVRHRREPLLALLRSRATQTNEIGRAAVLWAALQQLAGIMGQRELALLDFGCSAGLNLGVDDVHVADGAGGYGAADDGRRPCLALQWRGARPAIVAEPARWRLAARVGADLAPIDPSDTAQARWLQACLWPGDAARRERLQRALAQAAARRDVLLRGQDALALLAAQPLPGEALPVLFNAWVLPYLDDAAWQRHKEAARALVIERGWAWISAEPLARSPLRAAPARPAGEPPGSATLWSLHWRNAQGALCEQALAWSHPHGRWAQWLA